MSNRAGRKPKAKPVSLAGMGGGRIIEDEAPDPYQKGKTERVQRRVYDRTIEDLAERGHLCGPNESVDGTAARLEAAKRFLALYHAEGGKGARAIDYSRVKVDSSFGYDGTPESQAIALREMANITGYIGPSRKALLHNVICVQSNIEQLIMVRRQRRTAEARDRFYFELREALDMLIKYWGQAEGREYMKIRTEILG